MYQIELIGSWSSDIPTEVRERIEKIIAWEIPHESAWYPQPGRTLVVADKAPRLQIKVKGAGFYNPSDVSFAGTRRTTVPVPEGPVPTAPLQQAFKRDLIHVDPANEPPHLMESVHSVFAPVGGMTLEAARNDQLMFTKLTAAGLPSNRPLVVYKYHELFLDDRHMGVSVSQFPEKSLSVTPYDLYLAWDALRIGPEPVKFLRAYSNNPQFSLENPEHRLAALAKLACVAGGLLLRFSTMAGLYRFSGSPDNWNIRSNPQEPLFFSDVDTSRSLDIISPAQWGWEVLRNLISAIHQWIYFFLPCLTYEESGYHASLLQNSVHDFVRAMLSGFFLGSNENAIQKAAAKIWRLLEPVLNDIGWKSRIGLRTGEYELRKYYPRPTFYFAMLAILSDLVQGSELQRSFPTTDTTPTGIHRYINASSRHSSHSHLFPGYAQSSVQTLVDDILIGESE